MAHDSHAENLRAELKSLADTLEEVLNSSTDKPKAELDKLRSKAEGALKETRARLSDADDILALNGQRNGLLLDRGGNGEFELVKYRQYGGFDAEIAKRGGGGCH